MKASELRIGNLVKLEGISRPIKVSIIDTTETSTNTKYKPIPLTEEWLVKLGFEKVLSNYEEAETYDFFHGNIYLNMANNSIKFNGIYILSFIPESVHTLQNLYWCLCGEELKIDL